MLKYIILYSNITKEYTHVDLQQMTNWRMVLEQKFLPQIWPVERVPGMDTRE